MVDQNADPDWDVSDAEPAGPTVAEQLSTERKRQELTLDDVANRTRVPKRHLINLENAEYSALPGTTYAIGFVRNYARALGLDSNSLTSQLREELAVQPSGQYYANEMYLESNPARIPPKVFAWSAIAVLAVILVGYGIFKAMEGGFSTSSERPASEEISIADSGTQAPEVIKAAAPTGPVIITANQEVWLRIYQINGERFYEATMKKGDSYTIPDSAKDPVILTGRPQALDITVGGTKIAPLGKPDVSIADIPVSAQALIARGQKTQGAETSNSAPNP